MEVQSLNGLTVLHETELLLFHSAGRKAQFVTLETKSISGVGLGSGTETTRALLGLIWGLGLRLQEHVTPVHSVLYKTVDIETETDHKSTNRFSVAFLITLLHRVITTFTL